MYNYQGDQLHRMYDQQGDQQDRVEVSKGFSGQDVNLPRRSRGQGAQERGSAGQAYRGLWLGKMYNYQADQRDNRYN